MYTIASYTVHVLVTTLHGAQKVQCHTKHPIEVYIIPSLQLHNRSLGLMSTV